MFYAPLGLNLAGLRGICRCRAVLLKRSYYGILRDNHGTNGEQLENYVINGG